MAGESDLLEYTLIDRESSDFGATFSYSTLTNAPCSLGSIGFGGRLVIGGLSQHAQTTVVIRKSVFNISTPLAVGKPISVTDGNGGSRNLKIANDGIEDLIYAWQLLCDDVNEGA